MFCGYLIWNVYICFGSVVVCLLTLKIKMMQFYQSYDPFYERHMFWKAQIFTKVPKVGASQTLLWEAGLVLRSGSISSRRVEFIRKYTFFIIVKHTLSIINFYETSYSTFYVLHVYNMPIPSGVSGMSGTLYTFWEKFGHNYSHC